MIGRLTGTIASESLDGTVVIDVHGVGYDVTLPVGTLGRAPRGGDGQTVLFVHTHVREDAIVLFGFSDERERATFRTLTSVAGVGPKIAVAILGSLPTAELAAAIARSDVKRLVAVPGVGKKIAERLVLELKDKLGAGSFVPTPGIDAPVPPPSSAPRFSGPMGRVVDALVRLGFKPAEAERAAAELKERHSEPLDVLVREALRSLMP